MRELQAMTWTIAEERFAAKDYRGAGRMLAQLVEEEPTNLSARLLLARSWYHAALLQRAHAECTRILDQDPTERYGRLLMARTCERMGRKDEAATHRRLLAVMTGEDD